MLPIIILATPSIEHIHVSTRALYRTKLLPVTHVLVDTWILTVKPVYKL